MGQDRILRAAVFTPGVRGRWGLPTLVVGTPGTSKTSQLEELALASGLHCETVIASLREPSDFLGLPIPTRKEDGSAYVSYAPPRWAQVAAEKRQCLVIFDELNTAPPLVQASLLRVILEGVVGDLKLPKEVRFLAAMNKTEEAAGGFDIAPPLANRFGHLEWTTPTVKAWSDWLLGYGGNGGYHGEILDADKECERVKANWDGPWAAARGVVTGFLRSKSELLLRMPKVDSNEVSRAWPSPRTWELVTRALASAQLHGLSEVETHQFGMAFIGTGAMSELLQYQRESDLPDPEKMLDVKFDFKHDKQRLDRTIAVLNSCVALMTPEHAPKREKRAKAFGDFLNYLILEEKQPDITLDSFIRMYDAGLMNKLELNKKCYDTLTPMLQRADIVIKRDK